MLTEPESEEEKAPRSVLKAATEYLKRGWHVVPVHPRSKKPSVSDWPSLRLSESELSAHFGTGSANIGLLLGEPSGRLVDIDLDAPEAVALGPTLLPDTKLIHGHPTKPRSHWWYVVGTVLATEKHTDLDSTCLVELRSTGAQTIVPPSIHPDGERLAWDRYDQPATVDGDNLRRQVRIVAAGALLSRHWPPKGSRHEAALALAGLCLREGWQEEEVVRFVGAVARAAGDPEPADRERAVRDTAAGLSKGNPTTGGPRLEQILGAEFIGRLQELLDFSPRVEAPELQRIQQPPWPGPLGEEAFCGLAGEVVRTIEPHSEADPVALLAHLLVLFGAAVGRGPHAWAGDARHTLRVWPVLVGRTSKGRKGSSWQPNRRLFEIADPLIVSDRMVHGLSSGEGLICQVRDPIQKYELAGQGARRQREWTTVDPGVSDKRLFVLEEEFASVLRVAQRDGSTLSPVVRCAWDSGNLQSVTKNNPARATGAHIVVVGHVSRDELLRYLDRTEIASGFANRFLWLCTRRVHELPDGERIPDPLVQSLAARLRAAIERACLLGEMRRDEAAGEIWRGLYGRLSAERPGLLGAAIGRGEAQVLRISMLYAALDGSALIRPAHLLAAVAVWTYAEQSAEWIFGDSLGDPLADEILRTLRAHRSLTRNQIYELWGRHQGRERIGRALSLLLEYGRARMETRTTGGRPVEIWSAL